jgi:hypothetical protein
MSQWAVRVFVKSALIIVAAVQPVAAERIKNPLALFSGLDKITGVTTSFEIKVGEEFSFGNLVVKPMVCFSRPVTEEPKTNGFVQVDALETDGKRVRIFSGWMFAESPGLNAVDHPIFDVWLTGCRDPNAPPPPTETPLKPLEGDVPAEDTEQAAPTQD